MKIKTVQWKFSTNAITVQIHSWPLEAAQFEHGPVQTGAGHSRTISNMQWVHE